MRIATPIAASAAGTAGLYYAYYFIRCHKGVHRR